MSEQVSPDHDRKYCLVAPHYSEAALALLNVIRALPDMGLTPLMLVGEADAETQTLCGQLDLVTVIVPRFSWRNQLNGPVSLVREPLRVRRFCRRLFSAYPIQAALLVDDRRFVELFLIEEAHRWDIPCIVLMWAATNSARNMVAWRQKSLDYLHSSRWRFLTPLVRRLAPQALREIDGQVAYWQHPLAVLTLALCARYPSHPWVLGGGTADAIAVTGEYYRDMLVEDGLPANKVVVTGHPRHDDMVRCLNEWRAHTPEQRTILLAAPPVAHIKQGTRAGHVTPEQMNHYLHEVINDLLTLPYLLVVKPHPRDRYEALDYLSGHSRAFQIVRDQPIAPLIAGAELLVCQGSSVVFEACGLDVPVVTFDFYNTPGYDMWRLAGVSLHIEEREAFLDGVKAALFDEGVRDNLKTQRKRFVERYMRLDGKATERILTLIEQIEVRKS